MNAPALSITEQFAGRSVRFVGGRTEHRTRIPADYRWQEELLEAACGKKGWLARGYTNKPVRPCPGCAKVVGEETEGAVAA
ncbi:hypothetical protein ABZ341_18375 [Streptomyces sp. NPDC006173]|uniref:hypothetical protein n=1 Tax=Streptomyces sp. NPDC006173 TaxID=3155349 RepID=UPI0034006E89